MQRWLSALLLLFCSTGRRRDWHWSLAHGARVSQRHWQSAPCYTGQLPVLQGLNTPCCHLLKDTLCRIPRISSPAPGPYCHHDGKLQDSKILSTLLVLQCTSFVLLKIPRYFVSIWYVIFPTVSTVRVMQLCPCGTCHDSQSVGHPCLSK